MLRDTNTQREALLPLEEMERARDACSLEQAEAGRDGRNPGNREKRGASRFKGSLSHGSWA